MVSFVSGMRVHVLYTRARSAALTSTAEGIKVAPEKH